MRYWLRALFRCPDGERHVWCSREDRANGMGGIGDLFEPMLCARCGAEG